MDVAVVAVVVAGGVLVVVDCGGSRRLRRYSVGIKNRINNTLITVWD